MLVAGTEYNILERFKSNFNNQDAARLCFFEALAIRYSGMIALIHDLSTTLPQSAFSQFKFFNLQKNE